MLTKSGKQTYITMIKDNHALGFLADRGGRGIHFRCNNYWLLLIPEVVFAEYKMAQMLWQSSGLEYFNLKEKKGCLFLTKNVPRNT